MGALTHNHTSATINQAWHQRLVRERQARSVHVATNYGPGGKRLLEPRARQATREQAGRMNIRGLYGTASAPALSSPQDVPAQPHPRVGGRGVLPQAGAEALAMSATPSRQHAAEGSLCFFDDGQRRPVPRTPSLRSSASRLSRNSSLWREVESTVKEEVGKTLLVLQDQLHQEIEARQRAEAALVEAGFPVPDT